jgi:hypothetical protein
MNNLGFVKRTRQAINSYGYAVVGRWHDALLHKLLGYRFPMVCIKLIWYFFTDQKSYVTVACERSAQCGVPSGVPQGAVFSATLFTSDFSTLLTSNWFSLPMTWHYLVHLNPSKTQAVLFTKRKTRELSTSGSIFEWLLYSLE